MFLLRAGGVDSLMVSYQYDGPVQLVPMGVLSVSQWNGGWYVNMLYVEPVQGSRVYSIRVSGPSTLMEAQMSAQSIQGAMDTEPRFMGRG